MKSAFMLGAFLVFAPSILQFVRSRRSPRDVLGGRFDEVAGSEAPHRSKEARVSGERVLLAWLAERGWHPSEDEGFSEFRLLERRGEKRLWSVALASEIVKEIEAGRMSDFK
jgi:hypothetical protein